MSGKCILCMLPLPEKCPYSEFCWSAFSLIRIRYGKILLASPKSVLEMKLTLHLNTEKQKSKLANRFNMFHLLTNAIFKT